MSVETHMKTLSKNTASREAEGKQTTSIRPKSLRRAQIISTHIGGENITDFVSNSVDERSASLVKKLKIKLPADCEFTPKP